MKLFIYFSAQLILIMAAFISCKKEKSLLPPNQSALNRPPIASAGRDTSITLSFCSDGSAFANLDGSSSSDPDGNIDSYTWKKLYGPEGPVISNSNFSKTMVKSLLPGDYVFVLTVTDLGGLISKDSVMIRVMPGLVKQYDLDIQFKGNFKFTDNFYDCGFDYGDDCPFYDYTEVLGHGEFDPIGEFTLYANEQADTIALSDNIQHNFIVIQHSNLNGMTAFLVGSLSVNFKKLIRNGGGAFNGTFNIFNGSAVECDGNILAGLSPLTVTGNMDLVSSLVAIRIKGKVYF